MRRTAAPARPGPRHPRRRIDAGRQLAEIRAVLAAFDWEHHDRQTALERIDQIAEES
jgi:hypothetical protein